MDYANRGRPPQKKKRATAKKSPAKGRAAKSTSKPVPWLIIALAVLLIAAFAYFLVSIQGQGRDAAPIDESIPTADSSPAAPADLLPEKPQERWRYIEELENKEVEVDVPERELGPPKLMQCGSFRNQADAEGLRARIAMLGLESQVRESNGRNGRWFRVILGPYATKRDAERDRHKVQRASIFGCQIWNWNLDEL